MRKFATDLLWICGWSVYCSGRIILPGLAQSFATLIVWETWLRDFGVGSLVGVRRLVGGIFSAFWRGCRGCFLVGRIFQPVEELIEIGGDFGRLELDQNFSGFLWVFG